ncbi:hypothetical protein J1614_012136 [Plenodomus biglobosus]|nr:hypothetical protein J1614_012136 [Plenodomus biglobosus]
MWAALSRSHRNFEPSRVRYMVEHEPGEFTKPSVSYSLYYYCCQTPSSPSQQYGISSLHELVQLILRYACAPQERHSPRHHRPT